MPNQTNGHSTQWSKYGLRCLLKKDEIKHPEGGKVWQKACDRDGWHDENEIPGTSDAGWQ